MKKNKKGKKSFINLMGGREGPAVPKEVIEENEGENEECPSFRPFQVMRWVKISPSTTSATPQHR